MSLESHAPLQSLNFPSVGRKLGIHRRCNTFYVVLTRAYGIASGYKIYAQLNFPQPVDLSPDPPASHPHLHPRIWLREGRDSEFGNSKMTFEELMGAKPSIFKDTGLRRKVNARNVGGAMIEVEERLAEVLLKEDEYSQRCAWCGVWEDSGERTRHQKAGNGKDGRLLCWCGCSKFPKPFSRYWWQDPSALDENVYFFCQLP